ncbi:MAG: S-adenosylmethionine:tRNA ribosyltransferase-isomerase [Bacteroidota bacterium]
MLKTSLPEREINLQDYTYDLPEDRIARFPLSERDQSRLQVYQNGAISHNRFDQLSDFIPAGTLLVFNNTRVIPARMHFQKPSLNGIAGAMIEVFLLEPEAPSRVLSEAMLATGACTWHCLIGNKKRWRSGDKLTSQLLFNGIAIELSAELVDPKADLVQITWQNQAVAFADIIRHFGEMPLPPYIKRKATQEDEEQYQTIYSKPEGAVAAPTAGLHFTEKVLADLSTKGIATDFLTLHVGAGTFQPIKEANVWQHPMHSEQIVFTKNNLQTLLAHLPQVFAVGTTSLRALESIYWFGIKLLAEKDRNTSSLIEFKIDKLFPYQFEEATLPSAPAAIQAVLAYMQAHGWQQIVGETEILMVPGYRFNVGKGLVTNYHLPGTTLMLLVAAFIGNDWRRVYQEALANNYRFLSYGDSSLLIP